MGVAAWLELHLLPCPIKMLTGLECPGCGIQRAFTALLRGDLAESFRLFPALLPLLFTLILLLLHLRFRFRNGAAYLRHGYLLTTAIVLISYAIKMTAQH